MKVKIFSHKSDPDGIGSVIVVSLAYQNASFEVFPNNRELDERLDEFLSNKEYLNYDKIYIADLCPNNALLKKMASLTSNPFVVYDHHLTSSKETESYPFVHIEASSGQCATSLLYQDLKGKFDNETLNTLVYLTRMHDTWLWKEENVTKSLDLESIYHYLGAYGYYYYFRDKCLKNDNVFFNKEEERWLIYQNKEEQEKIKDILNRLVVKQVDGLTFATVYGPYLLRNLVADSLRDREDNIDILIYLTPDNETISFRSISGVPVNDLAEELGGGGHAKSASTYLSHETEGFVRKKYF